MAAKYTPAIYTRSSNITECSICTKPFVNPRCLPCNHTFCLNCLKDYGKSKTSESLIPCPSCKRMFTISTSGYEGLSKNYFVEHLLTMNDSKSNPPTICDLCSDADDDDVATATGYCVECRLNLCAKCSARHRKQPFAKRHNMVTLKEKQTSQSLTKMCASYCEKHPEEQLKLFCYDCKATVCLMCFAINHNGHNCADINKAAEIFKEQLAGDSMSQFTSCLDDTKNELQKLDAETPQLLLEIDSTLQMTRKKSKELKSRIDSEVNQLEEQFNSFKEKRMKQIEGRRADLNIQLATMQSFIEHSNKLLETGSACDISRSANEYISQGDELVKSQTKFNNAKLMEINVCYDSTCDVKPVRLNVRTNAQASNQVNSTPLLGMITFNKKQVSTSQMNASTRYRASKRAYRVCPHGCQQAGLKTSQYHDDEKKPASFQKSIFKYQTCSHGAYQSQCRHCKTEPEECFHGYEWSACPNDCISEVSLCIHGY